MVAYNGPAVFPAAALQSVSTVAGSNVTITSSFTTMTSVAIPGAGVWMIDAEMQVTAGATTSAVQSVLNDGTSNFSTANASGFAASAQFSLSHRTLYTATGAVTMSLLALSATANSTAIAANGGTQIRAVKVG